MEENRIRDEEQRLRMEANMDELRAFGYKAAADREDLTKELTDLNVKMDDSKIAQTILADKLDSTKKVLHVVADHLTEKSRTSTKNPIDKHLVHHALVMVKEFGPKRVFKFSSGQSEYIDKIKKTLIKDDYEEYADKFYQANGIDYRRNVQNKIQQFIDETLTTLNTPIQLRRDELKEEIENHNELLAEEINKFNNELFQRVQAHNAAALRDGGKKVFANGLSFYYKGKDGKNIRFGRLRSFAGERRNFNSEVRQLMYRLITIPIKVCSLYVSYEPNPHISMKEITDIIDKVNAETQDSPYVADE